MDFSKKRNLFKRPNVSNSPVLDRNLDDISKIEQGSRRTTKPLPSKIARKLGPGYQPRDFVGPSTSAGADFALASHVIQPEPVDVVNALSADEKNKLSARILKAELIGNYELAKKLKAQLESGSEANDHQGSKNQTESGKTTEVILMKTDLRTGLTVPYREKRKTDLREESEREACSSHQVLQNLVEEERMTSTQDTLAMIGDMASKSSVSQRIDSDWTVDDVLLSRKKKQKQLVREKEKERAKTVKDHERLNQTLDSCIRCIDSRKLKKRLIIATGIKTYLSLPSKQSLVEGHCLIVPVSHVSSSVQLDEDVYDEMKIWRKGLVAMFRENNQDCIFMETAKNVHHQPHMCIECIPLPQEVGDTAPVYFKKAILECEKEWSDNKKLVDLSVKDVRRAIPKGFSYFSVDFGLQNGFAHVIEDEHMFPPFFGKEIIGGMLDLEHNLWRNPRKETFEEETEKVRRFKELWTPFDWTERVREAISDDSS